MIDFKSYSVISRIIYLYLTYINKIDPKLRQHFLTRLKLCSGYKNFNTIIEELGLKVEDLFEPIIDDIESIVKNFDNYKDIYKEIRKEDEKGKNQMKGIDGRENDELMKYVVLGRLSDNLSIIYRNNQEHLLKDIKDQISSIYDNETYKMIYKFIEEDKVLKNEEGTIYTNGIGYLYSLHDLNPKTFKKIDDEIFDSIAEKYIKKLEEFSFSWSDYKKHQYIYGLTHYIINKSNFYKKRVMDDGINGKCFKCFETLLKKFIDNECEGLDLDSLCEMSVCLKLSTNEYEIVDEINKYIFKILGDKNVLIDKGMKEKTMKETLEKCEHTNILFILMNMLNV